MQTSTPSTTEILHRFFEIIQRYSLEDKSGKFVDYKDPYVLAETLQLDKEGGTNDWDSILEWLEKYLHYSVKTNHPGFLNRMWGGANLPSILGEITTALTNTSAGTYEAAPVATLMEKYMIQEMLGLIGFSHGEGQMTTGSSNANMIAMLAARNICYQKVKQQGLFSVNKIFAMVSVDAHYSMDTAANVLGIGTDQLLKIPVTPQGEIDIEILTGTIEQITASGSTVFFMGATAGTTVRGAYDPILPLLALRKKYNFWLHIDAAWGGAALLSSKLRDKFLSGVDQVNSFTWDFHKMVGTALMCNVLLFNSSDKIFADICGAGNTTYLFRDGAKKDLFDLGRLSLQCGKRVDSLKWFLDWKFFGRTGLASQVENNLDLCRYAEEIIQNSPELEMVVPRQSFNVCFRFRTEISQINDFNIALRSELYKKGISLIGYATINDQITLRLLLTNKELERSDIRNFFTTLVKTGSALQQANC